MIERLRRKGCSGQVNETVYLRTNPETSNDPVMNEYYIDVVVRNKVDTQQDKSIIGEDNILGNVKGPTLIKV